MFKTIYNTGYLAISRISGYCQGMYGYIKYIKPIQDIQTQVIAEIYEVLNGNEEIDAMNPMSMVEFVERNEDLRDALMRLLIGDQLKMGRQINLEQQQISIYSYAYVATSILMDPKVDADLTFELQDVAEQEYLDYYAKLLL
jgi:hypothetical protein